MGVRRCPKCGSVWYSALVNCAFCGIEGEEVKGPISPAKLNLGRKGIEAGPAPGPNASDRDAPAGSKEPADPPKVEAPPPPAPEPPKEVPIEPPKLELPPPKIEEPPPERRPEPPPAPRPERIPVPRPAVARMEVAAPAPQIPSATVPLVFGCLGLVAGFLLPLTALVRHDKVMTTFALLAWAILETFAPFAWFTAQRYADQCRALGFSPAPAAHTGKVLGMAACFMIVFEFSALAVFVVFQILSGKVVCPLWK